MVRTWLASQAQASSACVPCQQEDLAPVCSSEPEVPGASGHSRVLPLACGASGQNRPSPAGRPPRLLPKAGLQLSARERVVWKGPSPGSRSSSWGPGAGPGAPLSSLPFASVGHFTLPPLLTSSARLEASTGAGVLGSGLGSRCRAVAACPGRPSLGSLCTCLARPSTVTCPPRALGHLSTAHPRGSGPCQLQVTSLVLAEASPLSAGSYRSPGSWVVWVGVGTVTQRQLLHPRGPRNTGHSDL